MTRLDLALTYASFLCLTCPEGAKKGPRLARFMLGTALPTGHGLREGGDLLAAMEAQVLGGLKRYAVPARRPAHIVFDGQVTVLEGNKNAEQEMHCHATCACA